MKFLVRVLAAPLTTTTTTTTVVLLFVVVLLLAATDCSCSAAAAAAVLQEGTWEMATPDIVLDDCDLSRYQNVADFIPNTLQIVNATETGFALVNYGYCNVTTTTTTTDAAATSGRAFNCTEIDFEQNAIAGADLMITSAFSGAILIGDDDTSVLSTPAAAAAAASDMDIVMDVILNKCNGPSCFFLERALDFPCWLKLRTDAVQR